MAGDDDRQAGDAPTETLPIDTLVTEVPGDIRDVSFSGAVRGYDRRQVDAYVERVNRLIAELEISRSPQAAVKHALDRVGEQTTGLLQRAREVAEELTATALAEAEHAARRAKVEAEEILEQARAQAERLRGESTQQADEILAHARAEAAAGLERAAEQARTLQEGAEGRLRALQADIQASTDARRKVLDELRRTAAELDQFASGAINSPDPPDARRPEPPTETIPARPQPGPGEQEIGEESGGHSPSHKLSAPRLGERERAVNAPRPRAGGSRRKA